MKLNLLSRGGRQAASRTAPPVPQATRPKAKSKAEEEPEAMEEEEDEAMDEGDEPEAMDDGDDETAEAEEEDEAEDEEDEPQARTGRARVKAILGDKHARAFPGLAQALALDTSASPRLARRLLKAAAADVKGADAKGSTSGNKRGALLSQVAAGNPDIGSESGATTGKGGMAAYAKRKQEERQAAAQARAGRGN